MEEILETLYAKDSTPKNPNCKSCKNKPKLQKSGIFWFSVWMLIMAAYGNIVLFKQIYHLIFG
jgi:hypothetical protein